MTPTLVGRIQTRIFLLAVIGGLWTLAVTPVLPGLGDAPLGDRYEATFTLLAFVLVLGIAWEFPYHVLQQFRWEKDWPTFFGLLTALNEGLLVWLLLDAGAAPNDVMPPGGTFLWHFASTWLVTFLFVNGPIRVPFIRWRFRGGRII